MKSAKFPFTNEINWRMSDYTDLKPMEIFSPNMRQGWSGGEDGQRFQGPSYKSG